MLDTLLARGAADYPAELAELEAPPLSLRLRGRLPPAPRVALVGTRSADPEAFEFARELAAALARAGVCVVSGGARGIDRAAHEGAIGGDGSTLVVLPSGFSPPYPKGHASLFARACARGGMLTEFDDGFPPMPFTFLRRNEIVAAISCATVVVQAPRGSGAMSTAAAAKRLGRPVFAVPAAPWDPRGSGLLDLLRDGARICTRAQDVLLVCPPGAVDATTPGAPVGSPPEVFGLQGDEHAVWLVLGTTPRHTDEIARATGLPVSRIRNALLGLLLDGRIDEREGERYVRAPRAR